MNSYQLLLPTDLGALPAMRVHGKRFIATAALVLLAFSLVFGPELPSYWPGAIRYACIPLFALAYTVGTIHLTRWRVAHKDLAFDAGRPRLPLKLFVVVGVICWWTPEKTLLLAAIPVLVYLAVQFIYLSLRDSVRSIPFERIERKLDRRHH